MISCSANPTIPPRRRNRISPASIQKPSTWITVPFARWRRCGRSVRLVGGAWDRAPAPEPDGLGSALPPSELQIVIQASGTAGGAGIRSTPTRSARRKVSEPSGVLTRTSAPFAPTLVARKAAPFRVAT